ncbi:Uncharacterized protein TCM_024329 [Theobroma cacao]|uniref:Uncharacterized protein n=1 Tax=Theobroma cacao TaxID=3641 RepID=A0A061F392_THECC|nr:Uncharacterized protein TCM_024329 [Theobroma cacao]
MDKLVAAVKVHMVPSKQIDEIETIQWKLSEMMNTLSNVSGSPRNRGKRTKVSVPKRYERVQDAKELENFRFNILKYFQAMHTESEDKVVMASMYLVGDAKLCWSSKFTDALSAIWTANVETPAPHTTVEEVEEELARMSYIRFLSALQAQLEKMKTEPQRSLMYVKVLLNEKTTKTMLDTRASDTFITSEEEKRCSLKINLTVATTDDFDFVLGLDFMTKAQVIPFPAASCLMFFGERSCVVLATILPKSGKKMISAIQFKKGIKKGEPSYVAMSIYKGENNRNPIHQEVKLVLEKFQNMMPEQLPRVLPPQQAVHHEIELLPRVKPPAKGPYRMAPPKLTELKKQLDKLI